MSKTLKVIRSSISNKLGLFAFWVVLILLLGSSSLLAQTPEPGVVPEPANSSSSNGDGTKPKLTKAREEAKLFEDLRKKIRACFLQKKDNYATHGCVRGVNAQGTPRIDQKCKKRNIIKFEIDCELDIRSKIPYRERPKWDESRSEKIQKLQNRLDKLDGKVVKNKQKDKKTKKKNHSGSADQSWVTEME
jgi:hypothetical protein